ncbi:hypothetical protein F5Y14DRAFT_312827 [Nemania sp. NC0429]|nr:hypothetical protein F5Y14DRAFT_312827 [Nemania sp. NC0429]
MPYDKITRGGFSYDFGKFYAEPGHVELMTGSSLREAFLPETTVGGNKLIRKGGERFVRGQLKHYGITFNESEFSGNGLALLREALRAGKCDEVPPHIAKLRAEMHADWLARLTPKELSGHAEWVMERYFLTSGQPDRSKTTGVIGIPYRGYSYYGAGELRRAASEIAGLHQETGKGPRTAPVFLGWDAAAVSRAAGEHAAKEAEAIRAKEEERQRKHAALHADYLETLGQKNGPQAYSPVGKYIVNCEEIETQWPDIVDEMNLYIRAVGEPGVFEASFDFGVLVGVMILSNDSKKLERYDPEAETSEEEEDEEEEEEEEDEDERELASVETGSKRESTASGPRSRGRPSKIPRTSASESQKLYLKLLCTETGEGEVYEDPEDGTITFTGENMATFSGVASLPCVGGAIPFTGRKVADEVNVFRDSWFGYSGSVCEPRCPGGWD